MAVEADDGHAVGDVELHAQEGLGRAEISDVPLTQYCGYEFVEGLLVGRQGNEVVDVAADMQCFGGVEDGYIVVPNKYAL